MKKNEKKEKQSCAIEFVGLTKKFAGLTAVDNLNMEIQRGSIFGLLGPNGSGKTTTINMAAGLLRPTSGDLTVSGKSILNDPLIVKQMIGVVPEELALFSMLSMWEHLLIVGPIYGLSGKKTEERGEELLKLFNLWEDKDKQVDFASFGMKKKLSIVMALIHAPSVLFLDEPFKGLDPVASRSVRNLLLELSQKGITIFLTSHLAVELEQIIDQFVIIAAGKIVHHSFIKKDQRSKISLEDVFFRFIKTPPKPDLEWIPSGGVSH